MTDSGKGRPARGWLTSPINGSAGSRNAFPGTVTIHETILREGMQAPPVAFTSEDKVEIASLLDSLGISQIQVGYGREDREAIIGMKERGVSAQLSVLVPAFRDDWRERIDVAVDAGADILLVLFRASDRQLARLGVDRTTACQRLNEAVTYAREHSNCQVAANTSFATMADPAFLVDLARAGRDGGAERFGMADSTGVATPETIAHLVTRVRDVAGDLPVSVHTHDDFGLAIANAIAGLRAGAAIADASILGLGERAGNAPTEQLAVALEGLYGVNTGIALESLTETVNRIAAIANVPIPRWQPVVGEDVFAQKLEMHVAVTVREPTLHEPFEPETVGGRRVLRLGAGSGPTAVRAKLDELGIDVGDADVASLVAWINEEAMRGKRLIEDAEFEQHVVRSTS